MSGIDMHDALACTRRAVINELLALMDRVKVADLTTPEIVGLIAIFEAAATRQGTAAPVFTLVPRGQQ
jgi:hypothetical protein